MALTMREREMLQLAAEGLSTPEIASRLCVTDADVSETFGNIYGEYGIEPEGSRHGRNERRRAIWKYFQGEGLPTEFDHRGGRNRKRR